ncbi:hypothetical protein DL93DRAFT_1358718 [Clavulina sp. PMI_390]|nr:hypothetical protein DL93DRAFT_1358718 [Clavulina sp. PMI_390]
MPYVDLPQSEVQLWWISNIPGDDLAQLRAKPKPLVILLHPAFLTSEWRKPQLTDPTLNESCYMIALDGPNNGRSKCSHYISHNYPTQHDTWSEAAMLALFAHALNLPPFHIFAEMTVASDAAEKFAILFPQQCLSLTLLIVFMPLNNPELQKAYMDTASVMVNAEDFESLEEAHHPFSISEDDLDRFMEIAQNHHTSGHTSNPVLATCIALALRQPATPEEYARLTQPTLLMQGDNSPVVPTWLSEQHAAELVNSPTRIEPIQGACAVFGGMDYWAPTVNRLFAGFLASQPFSRDGSVRCTIDTADLRRALELVATWEKNPSISNKDPMSMWSYCRLSPAAVEQIKTRFIPTFTQDPNRKPFDPPEGQPRRKYSERYNETWAKSLKFEPSRPEPTIVYLTRKTEIF